MHAHSLQNQIHAVPDPGAIRKILIVDDSRAQRRILTSALSRLGYEVIEAESGHDALDLCRAGDVDLIVSDWMMPGMSGPELCQEFRELGHEKYGYFILLTSKSGKDEVARGLDFGADDFLTKPVSTDELRARIRAGERIVRMQRELMEKNRLVSSTLSEISSLYESLDKDLVEARKLQQSLVRERHKDFGEAEASLLLRPAGHVGGDLVGFFPLGESRVGLYAIDVSGHGVASALMTARLAAYLSGQSPEQNLALRRNRDGSFEERQPAQVAASLNRLMLEEMETEHYFTMLLAYLDLTSGVVTMTQCGHPNPAVQSKDGKIRFLGSGGLPVGLIPDGHYEEFEFQLEKGDRFLMFSDGITECTDTENRMLGDDGLTELMTRNKSLQGSSFFETLLWDLNAFSGDRDLDDDVSAILVEYKG